MEDFIDDLIVDLSMARDDKFLEILTISDTNLQEILWDFIHLPNATKSGHEEEKFKQITQYFLLYDGQKMDEKNL